MEHIRIIIDAVESEDDPHPPNLSSFLSLQTNACWSIREFDAMDASLRGVRRAQCQQQIKARSAYEVWMDASLGNPNSCLELGLRMYTGCGASKDRDGALEWWHRISHPRNSNFIKPVSRSLKARALSCLANAFHDKIILPNKKLHLVNLYRAAQLANFSASLGLLTPSTLHVAYNIQKIGLRRQADCRFEGLNVSCFEALQFLWKAKDARDEELKKRRQTRDAKVSGAPNLYVCAAEGCSIEGTSRSGLLRCSGNCPPVGKPSYCSRECQKSDWKHHRVVCTGEAKVDSVIVAPPRKLVDSTIGANMRNDGRELNIEVPAPGFPGGNFLLSSTIMSAAWLKQWRDEAEAEAEAEEEKSR